jgi:hypothetical protein
MGILNTIKNLFKKEEVIAEPIVEEQPKEEVITSEKATGEICSHCGLSISGEQRAIHKFGKVYHLKPCWRELFKQGKKEWHTQT